MEQLDDFIREQFDQAEPGERFAFREEHWAQALPLIEAAERKRRRRGWLWWLAGLMLLCSGWWGWQATQRPTDASQQATAIPQETLPGTGTPAAPSAYSMDQSTRLAADGPENVENMPLQKSGGRTLTELQKFGQRNAMTGTAAARMENLNPDKPEHRNAEPAYGSNPHPSAPAPTLPGAPSNVPAAARAHSPQPTPAPGILVPTPGTAQATNQINAAQNALLLARSANWRNLPMLPITFRLLTKAVHGQGVARVPYAFPRIRPVREPRFAVGLQIAASAYRPVPAGQQWGSTAGVYTHYWLRPAWSLATGVAWRSQPTGNHPTDTLATSRQVRYRFGYEEETYLQVNRRLHFVELPLSINWHFHAWRLETGAAWGQLVGVRAALLHTSRSSLAPVPETREQPARGEKGGYNRHYVAPFAGLGWQPLQLLHLNLRASYRPASLLSATAEAPDHSGHWRLDAGLRWQLFSHHRIRIRR